MEEIATAMPGIGGSRERDNVMRELCAWPGCKNSADPRWYVHLPELLPACDGHGCAGECRCVIQLWQLAAIRAPEEVPEVRQDLADDVIPVPAIPREDRWGVPGEPATFDEARAELEVPCPRCSGVGTVTRRTAMGRP